MKKPQFGDLEEELQELLRGEEPARFLFGTRHWLWVLGGEGVGPAGCERG